MQHELPLVSVVIPNYNYAQYLSDAIESVLKQTYQNIEIIVVDDGSTDNSREIASRCLDRIALVCKENGGVSSARNEGLSISKGSYICFLDADDSWEKSKVEQQLKVALDKNSGLVYSGYLECDSNLFPIRMISPVFKGDCEDIYRRNPGMAVALLGTSTALIRADLLRKIGMFDLDLKTSADWDYLRRISKLTDFNFVAEPLVRYRRHSQNMSAGSLIDYYADNEKALKKMLSEYSNFGLRSILLNSYSRFRFYIGASSAFLKSGNFKLGFKHLLKSIFMLESSWWRPPNGSQ
jgi:glycosyltransferase involved in cell wall biosynthesis